MRITNTMMTNNTMRNVNRSKRTLFTAEQQMATQKKIDKPSDDPIVAIRALSLRTTLTEIEQYLKKNVPDAEAWIKLTETSLSNVDGIMTDIYGYCNQGSTDSFTVDNRQAIVDAIQQLRYSIYAEGNADYSGRYVFTGYRTDDGLTFKNEYEVEGLKYEINQKFTQDDITTARYMKDSVDVNNIKKIATTDSPETEELYRLRLAYEECDKDFEPVININGVEYGKNPDGTVKYKLDADGNQILDTDGNPIPAEPIVKITKADFEKLLSSDEGIDANTAYYIYDKGEIVFSADKYDELKDNSDITVTYQKGNFKKGDIKPQHYFDCTDITNNVKYTLGESQDIEYTINFAQSLKINTRANDVFSYDIGRDLDDLANSLTEVANIEAKLAKLKQMKELDAYSGKQTELDSMITATNKELDYAKNYMEALFAKGMTQFKDYQKTINEELADIGSREVRLTLNKSRLTQQQTTFKDLKSKNEDVELEDIAIEYKAADTVYQAAIATASKTVRQTLLDFI